MAVKTKRGLGRGLDSLIPAGESKKEVKKANVRRKSIRKR